MAVIRHRGASYFVRWTDPDRVRREKRVGTDKRVAEQAKAQIEVKNDRLRSGLISRDDLARRDQEARTLADHLADWRKNMVDRGKTERHADQYRDRASRLAALARGVRLADIEPGRKAEARERSARILANAMESARLSDLVPERVQGALNLLRDAGYSNQTANHYRAALRAFVRWCDDTGRTRDNPTRGVKGFNVEEDIRHVRRTLTESEFVRLIVAAENGPTLFGMPGPLRVMAYRLVGRQSSIDG